MGTWIQSHGFEVLIIAGVFSLIMSNAPPAPAHWGFWKLWAFGSAKALGASAARYTETGPVSQQFTQKQVATPEKVVTETSASSVEVPNAPKS